jgi:AAA15 family ATPase/GTPase
VAGSLGTPSLYALRCDSARRFGPWYIVPGDRRRCANRDRIVKVRFAGLRTAADVPLDGEPMNVLIGPNGVGKSTLIEGLAIVAGSS